MKSDVIIIDNKGNGFDEALDQTKKVAVYTGLDEKETVRLQLLTEEMLSLARSITGEMEASFWMETEGKKFDLHMSTKTVMDKEKRYQLISTATSRKNEAANSFLGKLRDSFEQAMVADAAPGDSGIPDDVLSDLVTRPIDDPDYDGYEQSVLRQLADNIKIGIVRGNVDMTVSKTFE